MDILSDPNSTTYIDEIDYEKISKFSIDVENLRENKIYIVANEHHPYKPTIVQFIRRPIDSQNIVVSFNPFIYVRPGDTLPIFRQPNFYESLLYEPVDSVPIDEPLVVGNAYLMNNGQARLLVKYNSEDHNFMYCNVVQILSNNIPFYDFYQNNRHPIAINLKESFYKFRYRLNISNKHFYEYNKLKNFVISIRLNTYHPLQTTRQVVNSENQRIKPTTNNNRMTLRSLFTPSVFYNYLRRSSKVHVDDVTDKRTSGLFWDLPTDMKNEILGYFGGNAKKTRKRRSVKTRKRRQ